MSEPGVSVEVILLRTRCCVVGIVEVVYRDLFKNADLCHVTSRHRRVVYFQQKPGDEVSSHSRILFSSMTAHDCEI